LKLPYQPAGTSKMTIRAFVPAHDARCEGRIAAYASGAERQNSKTIGAT
jgi:hypothetical protein